MFDGVGIVRHPGWNFARWNMDRRPASMVDGEIRVSGVPLVFMHFSGLLSGAESVGQQRNPDIEKSLAPEIRALIDEYAKELERLGAAGYSRLPHAFARSSAGLRAAALYQVKSSARHLSYAVTTTAFRLRVRSWLRKSASR